MDEIEFATSRALRAWLSKNHKKSTGVWLRIFKKNSGSQSVTYEEAVDQAICFGWVDGQKKPKDSQSWLQKFTPRRPGSQWSKKNTLRAERLMKAKKISAAGRKEIEEAKADGRWQSAYESSRNAALPPDFLKALAKNKKAMAFFKTLSKTNLYSIYYRLQTAKKAETRQKRIKAIIEMLARGETFH